MNFLIIRVGMSVVPSVIDIIQLINMYVCVCVSQCMYVCVGGREGSNPCYRKISIYLNSMTSRSGGNNYSFI